MVNDDIRTSAPYPASEKTVPWELFTMAWIVLVISGLFEAVWATALGKSDGFSKMSPTVVFILGLIVSMVEASRMQCAPFPSELRTRSGSASAPP